MSGGREPGWLEKSRLDVKEIVVRWVVTSKNDAEMRWIVATQIVTALLSADAEKGATGVIRYAEIPRWNETGNTNPPALR